MCGEEQELGKHPSTSMFPASSYFHLSGFPEPVEFDLVALNTSSVSPGFLHHDILWQGVPPICCNMLHEKTSLSSLLSVSDWLHLMAPSSYTGGDSEGEILVCPFRKPLDFENLSCISLQDISFPAEGSNLFSGQKWFCTLDFLGAFPWLFYSATTFCLYVCFSGMGTKSIKVRVRSGMTFSILFSVPFLITPSISSHCLSCLQCWAGVSMALWITAPVLADLCWLPIDLLAEITPNITKCESSVHHPPFLWISLYVHLLLQVLVDILG